MMESVNEKKKRSIIQMYHDGKSAYEIARVHEISMIKYYDIIDQAENERKAMSVNKSSAEERKAKAIELAATGMKRTEIADRLSVHITTVNKYLSKEEYHFLKSDKPAEKKEPTDTEKKHLEQIRKVYKKGDTQTILVKKTGLSKATMNNLFRKFNLNEEFEIDEAFIRSTLSEASRKGRNKAAKARLAKKNKNIKKAKKLIGEGKLIEEVAEELGVSVVTVKRYLKEDK